MEKIVICAKCKHRKKANVFTAPIYDRCKADKSMNYVSGKQELGFCMITNKCGDCSKFERK